MHIYIYIHIYIHTYIYIYTCMQYTGHQGGHKLRGMNAANEKTASPTQERLLEQKREKRVGK